MGESLEDLFENYGGSGGGDFVPFFHLKDDRDTALVRFMHMDENDLLKTGAEVVHPQVDINGKERKVACLKTDDCPLCKAGLRQSPKFYLQLLNYDEMNDEGNPELQVWERGRSIYPDIMDILERYGVMFKYTIEIVRHGERGDQNTQYRLHVMHENEDTIREDNEDNREFVTETRQQLIGPEKYNTVIKRDKEDLVKMAEGTFKFESSNGENSENSTDSGSDNGDRANPSNFF